MSGSEDGYTDRRPRWAQMFGRAEMTGVGQIKRNLQMLTNTKQRVQSPDLYSQRGESAHSLGSRMTAGWLRQGGGGERVMPSSNVMEGVWRFQEE